MFLFTLLLAITSLTFCQAATPTEVAALISFAESTNVEEAVGGGWNLLDTANVCDWGGIWCSESGAITELNFNKTNAEGLKGSLPSSLKDLVNLKKLTIFECDIVGEIPRELGELSKLETLQLIYLNLVGEVSSL